MVFALTFFSLIVACFGYLKFRFIFNPLTSMFLPWAVILPFSNLGLYGVKNPSGKLYALMFIGLVAFFVGVLIASKNVRIQYKFNNRDINTRETSYVTRYRLLFILDGIAIAYYLFQLNTVIHLLLAGYDYSYIRGLATNSENAQLYSSRYIYLIKAFVAVPMTYLTIALFPVELFFGNKNKPLIIMAITLMVLFVLTTGGRSVILWLAVYFACVYLVFLKRNNRELKVSRKLKIGIAIGALALFLFMLYITKSRKGQDVDILRQFFIYFVAPLEHFDHYIDVVDNTRVYGYGLSSFYGLLYPFIFLLKFIGVFSQYPEFVSKIYYMSFEMMETSYNIGGGFFMNAFVTVFYQPYLDGRFFGVLIILFIFGVVCGRFFVKAYYHNDTKYLLLYILLLQKILFSMVRFYFTQQTQALCFVMAFFVLKKQMKERQEKVRRLSVGISNYSDI